jgi:hypothetical protein
MAKFVLLITSLELIYQLMKKLDMVNQAKFY